MTPMLSGALATQLRTVDLDAAAAHRVRLDLRRSLATRADVTRARVRLNDALARREAYTSPQVSVVALAP